MATQSENKLITLKRLNEFMNMLHDWITDHLFTHVKSVTSSNNRLTVTTVQADGTESIDSISISGEGGDIGRYIFPDSSILDTSLVNTTTNGKKYEERYVHNLNKATLTMPEDTELVFNGGVMSNGVIKGENAVITAGPVQIFGEGLDIDPDSVFLADEVYPEWFGAKGDGTTDDTLAIQRALDFAFYSQIYKVKLLGRTYRITDTLYMKEGLLLQGSSYGNFYGAEDENKKRKGRMSQLLVDIPTVIDDVAVAKFAIETDGYMDKGLTTRFPVNAYLGGNTTIYGKGQDGPMHIKDLFLITAVVPSYDNTSGSTFGGIRCLGGINGTFENVYIKGFKVGIQVAKSWNLNMDRVQTYTTLCGGVFGGEVTEAGFNNVQFSRWFAGTTDNPTFVLPNGTQRLAIDIVLNREEEEWCKTYIKPFTYSAYRNSVFQNNALAGYTDIFRNDKYYTVGMVCLSASLNVNQLCSERWDIGILANNASLDLNSPYIEDIRDSILVTDGYNYVNINHMFGSFTNATKLPAYMANSPIARIVLDHPHGGAFYHKNSDSYRKRYWSQKIFVVKGYLQQNYGTKMLPFKYSYTIPLWTMDTNEANGTEIDTEYTLNNDFVEFPIGDTLFIRMPRHADVEVTKGGETITVHPKVRTTKNGSMILYDSSGEVILVGVDEDGNLYRITADDGTGSVVDYDFASPVYSAADSSTDQRQKYSGTGKGEHDYIFRGKDASGNTVKFIATFFDYHYTNGNLTIDIADDSRQIGGYFQRSAITFAEAIRRINEDDSYKDVTTLTLLEDITVPLTESGGNIDIKKDLTIRAENNATLIFAHPVNLWASRLILNCRVELGGPMTYRIIGNNDKYIEINNQVSISESLTVDASHPFFYLRNNEFHSGGVPASVTLSFPNGSHYLHGANIYLFRDIVNDSGGPVIRYNLAVGSQIRNPLYYKTSTKEYYGYDASNIDDYKYNQYRNYLPGERIAVLNDAGYTVPVHRHGSILVDALECETAAHRGTTAQRPSLTADGGKGSLYYDTTVNKWLVWNGGMWKEFLMSEQESPVMTNSVDGYLFSSDTRSYFYAGDSDSRYHCFSIPCSAGQKYRIYNTNVNSNATASLLWMVFNTTENLSNNSSAVIAKSTDTTTAVQGVYDVTIPTGGVMLYVAYYDYGGLQRIPTVTLVKEYVHTDNNFTNEYKEMLDSGIADVTGLQSTLNDMQNSIDDKQDTIAKGSVTIATSAWSGNTCTMTATGVTASNTVIVSPDSASMADYAAAGVQCTAQGVDTLTFSCTSTPTSSLTINYIAI